MMFSAWRTSVLWYTSIRLQRPSRAGLFPVRETSRFTVRERSCTNMKRSVCLETAAKGKFKPVTHISQRVGFLDVDPNSTWNKESCFFRAKAALIRAPKMGSRFWVPLRIHIIQAHASWSPKLKLRFGSYFWSSYAVFTQAEATSANAACFVRQSS